jgi:hypothetical protein
MALDSPWVDRPSVSRAAGRHKKYIKGRCVEFGVQQQVSKMCRSQGELYVIGAYIQKFCERAAGINAERSFIPWCRMIQETKRQRQEFNLFLCLSNFFLFIVARS